VELPLHVLHRSLLQWFKIASIVIVAAIGIGSRYFFKGKTDNIIEEAAEKIIEEKTGRDIDLSPSTPEKKRRHIK